MVTDPITRRKAGIVLPKSTPQQMIAPLREAMKKYYEDEQAYLDAVSNCKGAYAQFSMEECVNAYVSFYNEKRRGVPDPQKSKLYEKSAAHSF
jgi:hypothetical protein